MNHERYAEVWATLDREYLGEIVLRGPKPLFATIGGAHLYGFASPNSDVDLRGVFVLPAAAFLGLNRPAETLSVSDTSHGLELDWVSHDVRKFARMMIADNGYVLEQLFSPLVVLGGDEHEELKELGRGCITRGLFRHYRGFAHGRRKLLAAPGATVKHLLYAYRVYLTGIHALRAGRIQSNLVELNTDFRLPQIDELILRKREGSEKLLLDAGEVARHAEFLDALENQLEAAHAQSTLVEEPSTRAALDAFVIRIRLERLGR